MHRLAKGTVRVAFVGAQLDKDAWLHHINTPEGKRNVAMPGGNITQMLGMLENNRPEDLSKVHVPGPLRLLKPPWALLVDVLTSRIMYSLSYVKQERCYRCVVFHQAKHQRVSLR